MASRRSWVRIPSAPPIVYFEFSKISQSYSWALPLRCSRFEVMDEPVHFAQKPGQTDRDRCSRDVDAALRLRLFVVSRTADSPEASRPFRIVQDFARFGHSRKGREDQLRNRSAKPRANHHLCALLLSTRGLFPLLVCQAKNQPAHPDDHYSSLDGPSRSNKLKNSIPNCVGVHRCVFPPIALASRSAITIKGWITSWRAAWEDFARNLAPPA